MNQPDYSVAVAILNYNSLSYLKQFLPVIIENTPNWVNITIIDNASTDSSKSYVQNHFPEITWIQFNKNLGFAGGYQKGIEQLKEDYIVLLNSDVEVTPNWLDPLLKRMEADKQLAAIQPKIKSYQDKNYFEHAGAAGGFIDELGYPFCRGRIFDTVEEDLGQYDNFTHCFWASGACMVMRKSAYLEAGEMDARFFLHMEEIDLCWRMQRCGYRIACEPASTVYHVGGGSLPYSNPKKMYYNFRNSYRMLYKNKQNSCFQFLFVLIQRVFLDLVALAREFILLRWRNAWQIAKALFTPWYWDLQKFNTSGNEKAGQIYLHSIVVQYFLNGKTKFSNLQYEKSDHWR